MKQKKNKRLKKFKILLIFFLAMSWIATGMPRLNFSPKIETAQASFANVVSGTYIGNGSDNRAITGLGFQPDVVWIDSTAGSNANSIVRTSTMTGDVSKDLNSGSNTFGADYIQSLDSDGFTVGTNAHVNTNGRTYYWTAFKAASGSMDVGSYVGNSSSGRQITGLSLQPDYLIILPGNGSGWSNETFPVPPSGVIHTAFSGENMTTTNRVLSLTSPVNGFTLGNSSSSNGSGVTYHYIAWKEAAGYMDVGSYSGDGIDNKNITGIGFQPDFVTIKGNNYNAGVLRNSAMTGDFSLDIPPQGDAGNNVIQALQSDGFQVGTSGRVNSSGSTYYYAAFGQNIPSSFTQSGYRFFENADGTSVGSPLAAINTHGTLANSGDSFRLRMLLHITDAELTQNGETFKLQYVDKGAGTCSSPSGSSPASYTDVTNATLIAFNDNPTPTDGNALSPGGDDPTHSGHTIDSQSYEESNNFTNNISALAVGEDGQWDFSLYDNGAPGTTTYCFRIILSGGTLLDTYSFYPELSTAGLDIAPPEVLSVTASTANGIYGVGESISIQIQFNETVIVNTSGGTPTLLLETGSVDGQATYASGSGSDTLSFTYTVAAGDSTSDLDYVSTNALTLNGGSIKDGADNNAILNLPDPGMADSLGYNKSIILNTSLPRAFSGSYTGNAADNRAITGLGFQPDVVIVKSTTTDYAMIRTSTMSGDQSKQLSNPSTGFESNLIQSLDADGFTIGTDNRVNRNGTPYHWMAFKEDLGDMHVGTYTGNSSAGHAITGTGFQPDFVMMIPANASTATMRTSAMTNGKSYYVYGADNGFLNGLTSFDSDGFTVNAYQMNNTGVQYHYVAWKAAAGSMAVGSYAGNGSDNRNITGLGFLPEGVITRGDNYANATFHPASLSGDNTLDLYSLTMSSNKIQSLDSDGFQIGTDSSVNTNGTTYFWIAFPRNVPQFSISKTAGTVDSQVISGDSAYAHSVGCTGPGTCAAFTMTPDSETVPLTSIKISELGSVDANTNLSNLKIFYDTNGNWSDVEVELQYGSTVGNFDSSDTGTVTGALNLNVGTTYYFYIGFDAYASTPTYPKAGETISFSIAANTDVTSGAASGAPQTLNGTQTVIPQLNSATYSVGGDGGRSGDSVTLSGYGFGTPPTGVSRENCAGAVDTGCVRFGGVDLVNASDITDWSNTSITFNLSAAIPGNGPYVEVLAANLTPPSSVPYVIYPHITGMTTCSAGGSRDSNCGTNAAQEYALGDTYGLIQLNGDHFSTTAGIVEFTGDFGAISGTIHNTAEGPCSVSSWGNTGTGTTVCVQVSAAISDSIYDGTITLTRGADSKTDLIDLHILPRIALNTPDSGIVGEVISIDGDHFCQTGTCPVNPPDADYITSFGSTLALTADYAISCAGGSKWSHSQVCVKVPNSTPSGTQNTKIQANLSPLYESQRKDFTVLSTTPNNPVVTQPPDRQYKSDDVTGISVGGANNESSIILKADLGAEVPIDMIMQVEVQPTGISFTCTGTDAIGANGCTAYTSGAGVLEGTVIDGGGCDNCDTLSQAKITFSSMNDTTYHWQVRARNTTTNEYSSWVSYGGNAESATDFKIDTTPPVITNIDSGIPSGNTATITWDTTGEASTSQVQYNETGVFGACSSDCTSLDTNEVYNHSVDLYNLDSGATYYFRVRSQDALGNESISSINTFNTASIDQAGKTIMYFVASETDPITSATTSYFSVNVPESSPTFKNVYLLVTGLVSGGANPITIQMNGVSAKNYSVNSTDPVFFRFLYPITTPDNETNLNLNDASPCTNGDTSNPPCNKVVITPGSGMTIDIYSAKLIMNYAFDQ